MSDEQPRRSKLPEAPEAPSGYRSSRRGSKAIKTAKKAERSYKLALTVDRTKRSVRNTVIVIVQAVAVVVVSVIALLLVAMAVNYGVRWNAKRLAALDAESVRTEKARENLLVVGVEGDKAVGLLAMKVDVDGEQAVGIAIPDGAFIEVPGQGFERIGEAWPAGPDVALTAVSNYFAVPFEYYLAVPAEVYRAALTGQDVSQLTASAQRSNMTSAQVEQMAEDLSEIPQENVALVPMPVKPIKLGDQTYYEPQRDQIADMLQTWWGVDAGTVSEITRVIVYNGAGTPGIAGAAAQQLIRAGFRVVDTKNADRFDYAETSIVVANGDKAAGDRVRDVLGTGNVTVGSSGTSVTDVVIIIGKDYQPPKSGEPKGEE